jgi:hypothetical protein
VRSSPTYVVSRSKSAEGRPVDIVPKDGLHEPGTQSVARRRQRSGSRPASPWTRIDQHRGTERAPPLQGLCLPRVSAMLPDLGRPRSHGEPCA